MKTVDGIGEADGSDGSTEGVLPDVFGEKKPNEDKETAEQVKSYYAYILLCADNTLYSGFTTDLKRREETHNSGMGAKYTRSRLPVRMAYHEEFTTQHDAMHREAEFKKLTRREKIGLIASMNPELADEIRKRDTADKSR